MFADCNKNLVQMMLPTTNRVVVVVVVGDGDGGGNGARREERLSPAIKTRQAVPKNWRGCE
jgi:hypothetical protein